MAGARENSRRRENGVSTRLRGHWFDRVAEAHRRIEAGGLDGKLVLCPELSP
jgi:hypothetical protein